MLGVMIDLLSQCLYKISRPLDAAFLRVYKLTKAHHNMLYTHSYIRIMIYAIHNSKKNVSRFKCSSDHISSFLSCARVILTPKSL